MKNDFFIFSRQIIEQALTETRFDLAHNRTAALRCLEHFLGKEELSFSELSTDFMARFKRWMTANGRKESTARFYINQISTIYNAAAKAGFVPKQQLLKGIQSVMPTKMVRQILTEEDLRHMRYANLSDCKHLAYARDLFMFSVYGRGISFTNMAYIKKNDVQLKSDKKEIARRNIR